ncbi:MAG: hypothetical protein QG552_2586 [Thermodesulfobacteriota bacterium]|nr:hypothetical protein [Thermodesulfobacteriota bacterium]
MMEWNFISNHGLVFVYIAKHARSTAREIASAVNVTEWTVHKIISELETDGFVNRKREGRCRKGTTMLLCFTLGT